MVLILIFLLIFCGLCIWGIFPNREKKSELGKEPIICPRCGSTSITIQKRFELLKNLSRGGAVSGGLQFLPDVIANDNHRVCMQCGKKFKV